MDTCTPRYRNRYIYIYVPTYHIHQYIFMYYLPLYFIYLVPTNLLTHLYTYIQESGADSSDNDSEDSSDDDPNVRRSAISGKKIKLKIDKTKHDVVMDRARKDMLKFYNSQF